MCYIYYISGHASFFRVIFTQVYKSIDLKCFYDTDKLSNSKNLYFIARSQFYIEATNVNNKRVKLYRCEMVLLIISIFMFTLHSCVLSFL